MSSSVSSVATEPLDEVVPLVPAPMPEGVVPLMPEPMPDVLAMVASLRFRQVNAAEGRMLQTRPGRLRRRALGFLMEPPQKDASSGYEARSMGPVVKSENSGGMGPAEAHVTPAIRGQPSFRAEPIRPRPLS